MVGVRVDVPVMVGEAVTVARRGSGEEVAVRVAGATVAGGVTQALRLNARRTTRRARRGGMGNEYEGGWVMAVSS
jgi:hypothetical protein